ncbi:MAG TPA: DNA replication/repair protein RecF [Kofleriaceae bacterium]
MKIELLTAEGVRNLAPLELAPRARFNVFVGDNGQGKTNLLEAIYVVAALRSFRTARLADLVAFGTERARIGARVAKAGLTRIYEVELADGSRKVRLDGKTVRPLARYFGGFNVVVFTPEDLGLPRGSPSERRRFLDRAVFNLRADYLGLVQDYEKVLKQRNAVLRRAAETGQSVEPLLAVYDAQLVQHGLTVAAARAQLVAELDGELARSFAAIARITAVASIRYESETAGSTAEAFAARLRESRARDLASGSTQLGPHRDDLVFELDGREAGAFASQGQLRAMLLAWKTAELTLLTRVHGDPPILLLDDVSSELDPSRNAYLFEHLAEQASQCFITTTHEGHVLLAKDRADYAVQNGQISS